MPMTFTSCIPAQNFGLASETTIPGFQPLQLSPPAPLNALPSTRATSLKNRFLKTLCCGGHGTTPVRRSTSRDPRGGFLPLTQDNNYDVIYKQTTNYRQTELAG